MVFGLSALLNPSASKGATSGAEDGQRHQDQQRQATQQDGQEDDRSSERMHASLPKYTPPGRPRPSSSSGPIVNALLSPSSTKDQVPSLNAGAECAYREDALANADAPSSAKLEISHDASSSIEQAGRPGVMLPPTSEGFVGEQSSKQEPEHAMGLDGASSPTSQRSSYMNNQTMRSSQDSESIPVHIKQETVSSPRALSPLDTRRASTVEVDKETSKSITTLKQEYASRTQSPLRESSTAEDLPAKAAKKKTAPAKPRRGMATNSKKSKPAAKKRKAQPKSALKDSGSNKGTPATSSPTQSDVHSVAGLQSDDESDVDSDDDVEGSGDVYCLCRKPDNGTFMIGCDGNCDDWFHGKCVGIEEKDKNLLDRYICPNCQSNGVGRTSWKRICRRTGCRQAARVGKTAIKVGVTSKYCSDECGVLFFRQMTSGARGQDNAKKRRKLSVDLTFHNNDARGGVISVGEARAMLDQSDNVGAFRDLGIGVLSPPATPAADSGGNEEMNEMKQSSLAKIAGQKEQARRRHNILKARLKFVTMVKNEATRVATEKELKPRDYCGFDSRVEWSEDEFAAWQTTSQGQNAFELDDLNPAKIEPLTVENNDATANESSSPDDTEICTRKKCARHLDWTKLAIDDIRFEMSDNSNRMRNLEQEEKEIRERVAIRAKMKAFGQSEGYVEEHGWRDAEPAIDMDANENDTPPQTMDIDTAA